VSEPTFLFRVSGIGAGVRYLEATDGRDAAARYLRLCGGAAEAEVDEIRDFMYGDASRCMREAQADALRAAADEMRVADYPYSILAGGDKADRARIAAGVLDHVKRMLRDRAERIKRGEAT
jgi:hypothetical protein